MQTIKMTSFIVVLYLSCAVLLSTLSNGTLIGRDLETILDDSQSFYEYHTRYSPLEDTRSNPSLFTSGNPNVPFSKTIKDGIQKNIPFKMSPMDSPWPMASHDVRHSGRSPYNTTQNPDGVEKWRFACGEINSGIAIDNIGMIYFGDMHGLRALFPNGTQKWMQPIGDTFSVPAIDQNRTIYIGTMYSSPYLYALYSINGTLKWAYRVSNDIESSPAIGEDGTIYFGDWSGWIHALNPDGTLKWKYHTGDIITASPSIGPDGTVYIGSHDHNLYAFNPQNGSVKWIYHTGDWVRVSPCVGDDGTVYCVSIDGYLYALYPNNGTMKWRYNVGAGTNPTIAPDGTIYAGWNTLYAINPDGTLKWSLSLNGAMEGSTPCTSHEGIIYFGTTSDKVYAINPNGTIRWQNNFTWSQSAPAIDADGTLYIGSGPYLRAFGAGEQKTISITQPKPGRLYVFGRDKGNTNGGMTFIIGKATFVVEPSLPSEIDHLDFYLSQWYAKNPPLKLQFSDNKSPFEWELNQRITDDWHWVPPLCYGTVSVIAYYKGGCQWSDSKDKFLYFHILKN